MHASSGTSSASALPFTPDTSSNTPKAPTSSDDKSQSFADALHQHGGDSSSDTKDTKSASSSTSSKDTQSTGKTGKPVTTAMTTPAVTTTATVTTVPAPVTTEVAALAAPAAVASNVAKPPTADDSVAGDDKPQAPVKSKTSGLSAGSDLSAMIVQATVLASATHNIAPTTPLSSTPTKARVAKDATGAGLAPTSDPTGSTATDLSTLIARATTAAATATTTTTPAAIAKATDAVGKGMPILTSVQVATPVPTKEKKSSTDSSEGSFLQSSTSATKDDANPLNLLASAVTATSNPATYQSVATKIASAKTALSGLSTTTDAAVGTAHVEKKLAMNTDLNIPEMISGAGTNTSSSSRADVSILLNSNNDFSDALKQVVHIAQLNDATASHTPTRIAIELQTPPGAIVNVYVSKQNNQYRAQLSTNDPVALSWVQDKITSMRQNNDSGVEVKWLPAQLETTGASTPTASSNNSNSNWNRDGQDQQGTYQQPDERSQSQRQKNETLQDDIASVGPTPFAESLATLGRAA